MLMSTVIWHKSSCLSCWLIDLFFPACSKPSTILVIKTQQSNQCWLWQLFWKCLQLNHHAVPVCSFAAMFVCTSGYQSVCPWNPPPPQDFWASCTILSNFCFHKKIHPKCFSPFSFAFLAFLNVQSFSDSTENVFHWTPQNCFLPLLFSHALPLQGVTLNVTLQCHPSSCLSVHDRTPLTPPSGALMLNSYTPCPGNWQTWPPHYPIWWPGLGDHMISNMAAPWGDHMITWSARHDTMLPSILVLSTSECFMPFEDSLGSGQFFLAVPSFSDCAHLLPPSSTPRWGWSNARDKHSRREYFLEGLHLFCLQLNCNPTRRHHMKVCTHYLSGGHFWTREGVLMPQLEGQGF